MKRTSLLILMIAVTTLMAVGQKKSKIVEMEFDKMEHQFGTLEYSADGSCVFKFKNNSKENRLQYIKYLPKTQYFLKTQRF